MEVIDNRDHSKLKIKTRYSFRYADAHAAGSKNKNLRNAAKVFLFGANSNMEDALVYIRIEALR